MMQQSDTALVTFLQYELQQTYNKPQKLSENILTGNTFFY